MKLRVFGVTGLHLVLLWTGPAGAEEAAAGAENISQPTPTASPSAGPAAPEADTPPSAAPKAAVAPVAAKITPEGDDSERPEAKPESAPQANFGFGAQLGFYNPNGLTVHVGAPAIALEVTAGFSVLALNYDSASAGQINELKFLFPFEVSPQLVIHAVTFKHEMRGNLLFGYRYNGVLGHGGTIGGELEGRVSRRLALKGLWGVVIYPDATDRLRGDQVPADADFKIPPVIGWGLSVGLLYYP